MAWQKVPKGANRTGRPGLQDVVSVTPNAITIAKDLCEKHLLNGYVVVHVDEARRLVGFQGSKKAVDSFALRANSEGRSPSIIAPNCVKRTHQLMNGRERGRFPARWDEHEQMIVADLSKPL